MTKPMMDLRALVKKSGDADLRREMIDFAAERLMELEVGTRTGADYGEKSPDRLAQRNGCRDRDWRTRAGSVELRIPRLRTGSCFPSFFEPRRSVEKALTAVIQEAYVHGVSTRSMDDLVQAMGGTGISRSQISPAKRSTGGSMPCLARPIEGSAYTPTALAPDRRHLSQNASGRSYCQRCGHAGRGRQHRRPARGSGMAIGASQAEPFWTKLPRVISCAGP